MGYATPFPQPSLELAAKGFKAPPPPLKEIDPEIAELGAGVLDAAARSELWVPWLRKLAAAFDCVMAQVALFDFQKGAILLHCLATENVAVEPGMVSDYEDLTPSDGRAAFMVGFPGRAITTDDMDPEKLALLPVVQLTPVEVGKFMMVNLPDEPYWSFFSVLRHKDSEPFPEQQRARMASLGVFFSRAMAVFRAVEGARSASPLLIDTIDSIPLPMGVASHLGRIELLNSAACKLLGVNGPDAFVVTPDWGAAMQQAIVKNQTTVEFVARDRRRLARLSMLPGPKELILIEFDVNPDSSVLRFDHFCRHYGLTVAERRVLELLVEGETATSAAKRLGRSHETIRSQLRSMREKTGLGSQQALVVALSTYIDAS